MQVHVPDPAYTRSQRSRANFRLALEIAIAFVGLLWVVQLVNAGLDVDPGYLGIRPRQWAGLAGILLAPLLHGSFGHLFANSPPLLVLGTALLHLYPRSSRTVLPAVYLGPGIAVWLFARDGVHIGASGLVYGLGAYVLLGGILRRDTRAIAASLLACFMYGELVWGVLPLEPGVSWETHLAAAIIGVALALSLRHLDRPPARRYTWEDEPDVPGEDLDGSPAEVPADEELPPSSDAPDARLPAGEGPSR